jgi:hypothetical protein
MNTIWAETLSSLIDGEPVNPDVVADALESPEARCLLVDCVRLSAATRGNRAEPSLGFYNRMASQLHASGQPGDHRISFRVAAALVLATLLTALGVESWRHWHTDTPPRPSRVLRFDASEWTTTNGRGL